MSSIRILIADDHALFRDGVRAALATAGGCDVVGEAVDGSHAVARALELKPDVILMDIHMPALNGVDAATRILRELPGTGVIMLTMLEDDSSVFAAMRAGARGYILKGADKAELLRTIHAVAGGEALFGPAIAQRITRFFSGLPRGQRPFPELTERERDVLALIAEGKSNAEIADRLVISPKTVSNHISNIFGKLQVADRAQVIVKARQAGFGEAP
jgi:DNA-binding NarL/FixJ family response regulator